MSATRADAGNVPAFSSPPDLPRDLLPRMKVGRSGRRLPDGTVAARRWTRPGNLLFHLLDWLLRTLDVRERVTATGTRYGLRTLQVPAHPVVGDRLGLRWAGTDATHLYRGEAITWETCVRRYIAHYG